MDCSKVKHRSSKYIALLTGTLLSINNSWASEEIEEKIFIPRALYSYLPGPYQNGDDEDDLFTRAKEPVKPFVQHILHYTTNPSTSKYETVLMTVVPGRDGRQKIDDPGSWPHCIHTQITIKFDDRTYGGSGVLVGPHHVLTVAHNAYDKDLLKWASSMDVYPGLNGQVAPFNSVRVIKAFVYKEWINKATPEYDVALLLLEKSIGYHTGWGEMVNFVDEKLKSSDIRITGYPGDKGFKELWTMEHKLKRIGSESFSYEIDTYGGQSGSPIWASFDGKPCIIGVHTLGGNSLNLGVRLSHNKFRHLAQWIKDTYILCRIMEVISGSPDRVQNLGNPYIIPNLPSQEVKKTHKRSVSSDNYSIP